MAPYVERIVERLREVEDDLTREAEQQQKRWHYRIQRGRVWFDEEVDRAHRAFRQSIPAFIRESSVMTILTAPVIYSVFVPFALLDIWITLSGARFDGSHAQPRMTISARETIRAGIWALAITTLLAALIVAGSRRLDHFDAALVGYTFATLFATFGIAYRYAMWLHRPPTRLYWRRGWQMFLAPRRAGGHALQFTRSLVLDFAANRFIFRRQLLRGVAHSLIMWGCLLAAAITFPLVWGWIHFETVPGRLDLYRAFLFGYPVSDFPVDSWLAFIVFHGLVWAALLVIAGVMLAFRRRMIDHGVIAVQQFGVDVLPLLLLFAISVTGLMLTASHTWMHGYAYAFLAILHAITVIFTLLWLPFGKLFHLFQRPAQLGVSFYKDAGARTEQAACRRCGQPYASALMVSDLITVEQQLGFTYEMNDQGQATHYQQICPRCRRALFGLSQGALWQRQQQPGERDGHNSR